MKFYGENGVLFKNSRAMLVEHLKEIKGPFTVTVAPGKENRSDRQNRYFWACVSMLAKHIGVDKEEMADIIRYKFLRRERVIEETGEALEYLGHTSKLSKDEFSELVDNMQRWAAESLDFILPDPEEQMRLM